MKLYFLSKFKNMMSAKDRPVCPGGSMVLRSGTATCLIVRSLSTSIVLPVVLNFYLRLLSKTKKESKKLPEEKIPHKCLSIIILDSILYAYEKYHPQIFLEECKYAKENIKTKNYIDKELKSESDSNSDSDSDSDSDSGTNNEE